jgi:hypothetical protein
MHLKTKIINKFIYCWADTLKCKNVLIDEKKISQYYVNINNSHFWFCFDIHPKLDYIIFYNAKNKNNFYIYQIIFLHKKHNKRKFDLEVFDIQDFVKNILNKNSEKLIL